jgi:diguanylate cyclase (GGDEF)-like protein/PAS domain S-box-containing protein
VLNQQSHLPPRKIWQRVRLVALPLVVIVIGLLVAAGLFHQYQLYAAKNAQPKLLQMASTYIANNLFLAAEDAIFLAGTAQVRDYLTAPSPPRRQALEQMFHNFLHIKGHFDQARLLSPGGQELVRVDYNEGTPKVVALSELQDKSSRYYVQKSLGLKQNQIFVSRADLNVERGKIEEPHKPMQRFVMPVYLQDRLTGYIVINFDARQLFEQITSLDAFEDGQTLWLINRQGFWLNNTKAGEPWGFMLPERAGDNLNAKYPELWQQIQHSDQGYFLKDQTIYLYQHLNISHLKSTTQHLPTVDVVFDEDAPWVIISHQTTEEGLPLWLASKSLIWLLVYLLPFLTGFAFWWLLRRSSRFESDLGNKEHYLNVLTEQLIEALLFVDDRGCIRDANSAAVDIFGYPLDELVGLHISQLMPSDQRAGHENHFRQALLDADRANYFMNHVVQAMTKEGNLLSIKVVVSAIHDDGRIFFICSARDVTEEIENQTRLKALAESDPLTSLLNTQAFYARAALELKRARRKDSPVGLLFMDVDHFKNINDSFGHLVGDEVLTRVADVLRQLIREYDLAGRPGGDEFIILTPDTNEKALVALVERLQAGIAGIVLDMDPEARLSLSIGGVVSTTADERSLNDLIKAADTAMYMAKNQGRDCFVMARQK